MNQCFSCNEPCAATAIFCDACRVSLLNRQQKRNQLLPIPAQAEYAGVVEQAQAIHWSSTSSRGGLAIDTPSQVVPASPLPTLPAGEQDVVDLRQITPELECVDTENSESDAWMQEVDPLATRHLPNSSASVDSAEKDILIPAGKEATTVSLPTSRRHIGSRRLRIALGALVVVILLSLIVDAVLISVSSTHQKQVKLPTSPMLNVTAQPGLSLSPTSATYSTGLTSPAPGTSTPTAPAPGAAAPVMDISTSKLNFTYTPGQANPANQEVTVANTGGSAFSWQANVPSSASSWLSMSPVSGTIAAAQSAQIEVSVTPTQLTPETYSAQVVVSATDSSGKRVQNSPQSLTVTLAVFAACSLQAAPTHLTFTASLLQPDPAGQNITLKETGNCAQQVTWSATGNQSWLTLSKASGTGSSSITVHVNAQGMLPGTYSARITLSAFDSNRTTIQVSPQTIPVTLTVNAA
jgi:hypothetical protein